MVRQRRFNAVSAPARTKLMPRTEADARPAYAGWDCIHVFDGSKTNQITQQELATSISEWVATDPYMYDCLKRVNARLRISDDHSVGLKRRLIDHDESETRSCVSLRSLASGNITPPKKTPLQELAERLANMKPGETRDFDQHSRECSEPTETSTTGVATVDSRAGCSAARRLSSQSGLMYTPLSGGSSPRAKSPCTT
jgi:hypothetical protein